MRLVFSLITLSTLIGCENNSTSATYRHELAADAEDGCFTMVDVANACLIDMGGTSDTLLDANDQCGGMQELAEDDSAEDLEAVIEYFDCYTDWYRTTDCTDRDAVDEMLSSAAADCESIL